ncbi:MAG TPA: spondin domain-containing protein [Verrucomicrobiota bacterium]|nr:hypothetical protein [Verrucomicrobiales bacterium]HRI15953.1 spondin domain-containing protein [Verrucomicrobiota bacterium]
MKSFALLVSLGLLCLTERARAEVSSIPALPTVSISTDNGRATLSWTGGRSSYQLQRRVSFDEPWQNVGQPTTETHAEVPLTDRPTFFRVVADYTARFEVLFDATWSPQTHRGAWPTGAHWSGPVGGVHNGKVHFWKEGETASEGIRLMAERGQQGTLAAEIQSAIPAGNAYFTVTASGLGSPAQRVITFPQATTRDFPLLTLCSMIAPSPDWFVGVAGLSLVGSDGEWIQEQTVTLYGFDAGTDSGVNFSSPDLLTAPRGVVTRFTGYPALIDGTIVPFGTFIVRRVE